MQGKRISRRAFVGTLGAGLSVLSLNRPARAAKGPNDQIVLGMIGVGNQGTGRLREFLATSAMCGSERSAMSIATTLIGHSESSRRKRTTSPKALGTSGGCSI